MIRPLASSSAGNSILVDDRLLLDAGLPPKAQTKALGYRTSRLDACLVTHEHQDHARGVMALLNAGVDVYASNGTWSALGGWHHRAVGFPVPCETWTTRRGGWRVSPLAVQHDAMAPVAYIVEGAGARILYLTDSGVVPAGALGQRYDYVLIEANHSEAELAGLVEAGESRAVRVARSHLSVEAAAAAVADMQVDKQVWLLHMSSERGDEDGFARVVAAATDAEVLVAAEGLVGK